MKKTLITEINRIQELMGKPLITEATVLTKAIDELAILLSKAFKNIDGTLKKLIDDLNSPGITNAVKLNILTKLSKANQKMAEMIIPRIMKSLPQNVKDQISNFEADIPIFIRNKRAQGINVTNVDAGIDNFLNNMTGLNDDIRFMMKKYFTDYADKFLRNSPPPVVKPKIPVRQTSIQGKIIRFNDVLLSYLPILKKIEQKIIDDIGQYTKFKDEALRAPNLSSAQIEANVNAKRFLDRIDLNLGLLNRKNKELSDGIVESLKTTISKNKNDKGVLNSTGQIAQEALEKLKNKDTEIGLGDYFKSTDPNSTLWKEISELRNRRTEQLKTMFSKPKFDTVLHQGAQTFRFMTGDIVNVLKRIWKDPLKIPRILVTETGARIFNYTLKLAAAETIYDTLWHIGYRKDDQEISQMVKNHPEIAKFIEFTGPDYKPYFEDKFDEKYKGFALDFLANGMINWVEKIGMTIPIAYITKFLMEISGEGMLAAWFNKQRDKLITIRDSDLSPEEKQNKINEILSESDSWIETWIGKLGNESAETLEFKISKEFAALEKPTVFTNDEKGFKDWCVANQKSFKSYNKDNNGLGETTDGKVWKFKDGTFKRFFTDDEKGFKDWCVENRESFKSYNGGYGRTTDGKVWEFKDGTFQPVI